MSAIVVNGTEGVLMHLPIVAKQALDSLLCQLRIPSVFDGQFHASTFRVEGGVGVALVEQIGLLPKV